MRTRLRALVAGSLLLARRRARRDAALVLVWTLLLTVAVGVAVAAPRFVTGAIDAGAREAVAAAGKAADVVATTAVGASRADRGPTTPPDALDGIADDLLDRLPPALAEVYDETTISARGPRTVVTATANRPRLDVQVGMLTDANTVGLEIVDGALPTDAAAAASDPYPIAISDAAAGAASLSVGDVFDVPADVNGTEDPIPVEVVAIVSAVDASSSQWVDLPGLWTAPRSDSDDGEIVSVVPLATAGVVDKISARYTDPFTGTIRLRLDPEAFTGDLVAAVSEEQRAIGANSVELTSSIAYALVVSVAFPEALEGFAEQSRAAVAQLSLIVAGVLGVAASVLVLMSRLLVRRRRAEFALERARGSSALATVLRTLPQSIVTTGIAAAIVLLIAGPVESPAFVVAVVAIGVLADPLQSFALVRSTQTAKRAPANRRDRAALRSGARARRIAVEVTLIALAAAAIVSLHARGLLQESTAGIDPLVTVAPLLLAAAIAVVISRLYPLPVRLGARLAFRSPGLHGLMTGVRARGALTLLPLLALTLATGLATTNALLGATIVTGQESASWEQIGADVRIDGAVTAEQRDAIAAADGVTAAATIATLGSTRIELGSTVGVVTAVAIDEQYGAVVDHLPESIDTDPLDALFATADEIPVLVDTEFATRVQTDTIVMNVGTQNVTLRVAGIFDGPPTGYLRGPFIYLPLDALNGELREPVVADTTLVMGEGADAAVASAGIAPSEILSRATWLTDRRDLALVGGVQSAVSYSTLIVAVLAIIAILATVAAGTGERARTLSLLRTLGTPARFGWWLALSDLAPLVIASLVGGVGAGAIIAALLFPSMGLEALTGGSGSPVIVVAAASVILLVTGTALLLVVAILAEVVMHRRDRLNEVLRVGETV